MSDFLVKRIKIRKLKAQKQSMGKKRPKECRRIETKHTNENGKSSKGTK